MKNTKIKVSQAAIMKGWWVPEEGVWKFSLLPSANAPTFDSQRSTQEMLRAQQPLLPERILNVYDMKTKPELTRYYYAVAGFPTKPMWATAIKNDHYKTWPGLDRTMTAKYFPESKEMWRGHGRKIKSDPKQPVLEEEAGPPVSNTLFGHTGGVRFIRPSKFTILYI